MPARRPAATDTIVRSDDARRAAARRYLEGGMMPWCPMRHRPRVRQAAHLLSPGVALPWDGTRGRTTLRASSRQAVGPPQPTPRPTAQRRFAGFVALPP